MSSAALNKRKECETDEPESKRQKGDAVLSRNPGMSLDEVLALFNPQTKAAEDRARETRLYMRSPSFRDSGPAELFEKLAITEMVVAYLDFICCRYLRLAPVGLTNDDGTIDVKGRRPALLSRLVLLEQCYRFGNIVKNDDFLDAVVDAWAAIFRNEQVWSEPMIEDGLFYQLTGRDNPARQLALDFAGECSGYNLKEMTFRLIAQDDTEFVAHMVEHVANCQENGDPSPPFLDEGKMCFYHHHSKKRTPCYRMKHSVL